MASNYNLRVFFLSLFRTLESAILVPTLDLGGGVQPGSQSSSVISDVTSPVKSCQENSHLVPILLHSLDWRGLAKGRGWVGSFLFKIARSKRLSLVGHNFWNYTDLNEKLLKKIIKVKCSN